MTGMKRIKLLDPRANLTVVGLLCSLSLSPASWGCIAVSVTCLFTFAVFHGISIRRLLFRTTRVSWFVAVIIVLQSLSIDGTVALVLGSFYVTWEGLEAGFVLSLRLMVLLWGSLIIVWSTPPDKIVSAFETLLHPVRNRFGSLVMLLSVTMNLVPDLVLRSRHLGLSFRARGIDVDSGIMSRIRFISTAAIPLFASSVRSADQVATAMVTRGYDPAAERTSFIHLDFDRTDWTVVLVTACVTGVSLIVFH